MLLRKFKTSGSCMSCSFLSFSTVVRISGCFSTEEISCSPSLLLFAICGDIVGLSKVTGAFDEDIVLAMLDVDCLHGVIVELMLSELLLIGFLDIRPFLGLLLELIVATFALAGGGVWIFDRTASWLLSVAVSDDFRRRFTCKFRRSFIVSVSISKKES